MASKGVGVGAWTGGHCEGAVPPWAQLADVTVGSVKQLLGPKQHPVPHLEHRVDPAEELAHCPEKVAEYDAAAPRRRAARRAAAPSAALERRPSGPGPGAPRAARRCPACSVVGGPGPGRDGPRRQGSALPLGARVTVIMVVPWPGAVPGPAAGRGLSDSDRARAQRIYSRLSSSTRSDNLSSIISLGHPTRPGTRSLESCTPGTSTRQYKVVRTGTCQYIFFWIQGGTRKVKIVQTQAQAGTP